MAAMTTSSVSSSSWTTRPFFGGAISCSLPSTWKDVSDIREVPDNQEVWHEIDGAFLVVELLQAQEVGTDQAHAFFFSDLAETNGISDPRQMSFAPIQQSALAALSHVPGATLCGGVGYQQIRLGEKRPMQPVNQPLQWTFTELCVLRIPQVETDVLITLSRPYQGDVPPTTTGATSEPALSDVAQRIVASFQIHDFGLFQ